MSSKSKTVVSIGKFKREKFPYRLVFVNHESDRWVIPPEDAEIPSFLCRYLETFPHRHFKSTPYLPHETRQQKWHRSHHEDDDFVNVDDINEERGTRKATTESHEKLCILRL